MRSPYHPNVKGFEFAPEGRLLCTFIEIKGRMGIAYERSVDYCREHYHSHERLNLSFPRNACQAEIQVSGGGGPVRLFEIDSSKVLSIPKGLPHNHRGKTTVYDTMALYPSDDFLSETALRMGLQENQLTEFLGDCHCIRRNSFIEELVDRYFSARVLRETTTSAQRNSLEEQILGEVFRLYFGSKILPEQIEIVGDEHQTVTERALQFIEANLFGSLSSREIADYSRTSVASLFRVFKKDLARTPFEYIRERRLDEALQLVKGKQYNVSDVALLVGYEDLSAFSKAFKKRFRKNASEFLKA